MTNTTPLALSRSASRWQSSVRSEDRPADLAGGRTERSGRLVGRDAGSAAEGRLQAGWSRSGADPLVKMLFIQGFQLSFSSPSQLQSVPDGRSLSALGGSLAERAELSESGAASIHTFSRLIRPWRNSNTRTRTLIRLAQEAQDVGVPMSVRTRSTEGAATGTPRSWSTRVGSGFGGRACSRSKACASTCVPSARCG